jgi:hypothetical protein
LFRKRILYLGFTSAFSLMLLCSQNKPHLHRALFLQLASSLRDDSYSYLLISINSILASEENMPGTNDASSLPTRNMTFGEGLIVLGVRLMKHSQRPLNAEEMKEFQELQHKILAANSSATSTRAAKLMAIADQKNNSNGRSKGVETSGPLTTTKNAALLPTTNYLTATLPKKTGDVARSPSIQQSTTTSTKATPFKPHSQTNNLRPTDTTDPSHRPVQNGADGCMPPTIPVNLTEAERRRYVTNYRIRSLNNSILEHLKNLGQTPLDLGAFDEFENMRQKILLADGLPMEMPTVKRKSVESLIDDVTSLIKRRKTSSPTRGGEGVVSPNAKVPNSGSNERKIAESIVENSATGGSAETIKKGPVDDDNTLSAPPKTPSTPTPSVVAAPAPGSNKRKATELIVSKTDVGESDAPDRKPHATDTSTQSAQSKTSNTPTPSATAGSTTSSQLVKFAAGSRESSMSQFMQNVKNAQKIKKEIQTKRKAVEFVSQESLVDDEDKREREGDPRLRAKKKTIEEAAKKTPDSKISTTPPPTPATASTASEPVSVPKRSGRISSYIFELNPQQSTFSGSGSIEQGQSHNIFGHLAKQAPDSKVSTTIPPVTLTPAASSPAPKALSMSKPKTEESSSIFDLNPQQNVLSAGSSLGQDQSHNIFAHLANQRPRAEASTTEELDDYESDEDDQNSLFIPMGRTVGPSTSKAPSSSRSLLDRIETNADGTPKRDTEAVTEEEFSEIVMDLHWDKAPGQDEPKIAMDLEWDKAPGRDLFSFTQAPTPQLPERDEPKIVMDVD